MRCGDLEEVVLCEFGEFLNYHHRPSPLDIQIPSMVTIDIAIGMQQDVCREAASH